MEYLKQLREINQNTDHFHEHTYYLRTLVEDKKNVEYLEIGSYTGSSAALMCDHPSLNATLVDPCTLNRWDVGQEEKIKATLVGLENWRLLKGKSTDVRVQKLIEDRRYDVVFIDGSHEYKDVVSDILFSIKVVKDDGVIVIDDYYDAVYCPQVREAVDDMEGLFTGFRIEKEIPNTLEAEPKDFKFLNLFILRKI